MNKTIIALATIAAAGATTYVYKQQSQPSNDYSALTYVPADVALFSGQLEPISLKDYIQSTSATQSYPAELKESFADSKINGEPSERFLANLADQYLSAASSVEELTAKFGFAEKMQAYFYNVGALPVFKYQVEDKAALLNTFAAIGTESGIEGVSTVEQGVEYTSYTLEEFPDGNLDMVVSVKDNWATVTFNTPFNDAADLNLALSIEKPTKALTQAYIEQTLTKYQLDTFSLSFVNHVEIVKAITSTDGNRLATMLTKILAFAAPDALTEVRTAECNQDFLSIANDWPRTVFGTQGYEFGNGRFNMNMRVVIEGTDVETLDSLKGLRGFIPEHAQSMNGQLLSAAFGINVNELVPSLTSLWTSATQAEYSCAPLVEVQEQLAQANPMMLGMMTGMVNGLKGISASILDMEIDFDVEPTAPKSLDALLTVSADDPLMLFNALKAFAPPVAGLEIPADGTPVKLVEALGLPAMPGLDPEVALKGQHIVIYNGDKGKLAADKLSTQTLTNNGLFSFGVDSEAMVAPMQKYREYLEAAGQEVPADFDAFKNADFEIYFEEDFSDKGFQYKLDMTVTEKAE